MNTYNEKCMQLHGALRTAAHLRGRDDRGEVSSYLILVALIVAAVAVVGLRFSGLFTALMNNICTEAGVACP